MAEPWSELRHLNLCLHFLCYPDSCGASLDAPWPQAVGWSCWVDEATICIQGTVPSCEPIHRIRMMHLSASPNNNISLFLFICGYLITVKYGCLFYYIISSLGWFIELEADWEKKLVSSSFCVTCRYFYYLHAVHIQ